MAAPPAPPNKKRQRMILIGAAAAGLLLLLYLRSRSSSSPNATSAADAQNAYAQGAQAQAVQDQSTLGAGGSTFADNGANAAALGDALTQGLQQVTTSIDAFQNTPPSWFTPSTGDGTTPAPAPSAPANQVTINVSPTGSSVGTGTNAAPSTQTTSQPKVGSKVGQHGAMVAPSGHNKPPPKKNYTIVGTGKGGWLYVPKPGTPAYHK